MRTVRFDELSYPFRFPVVKADRTRVVSVHAGPSVALVRIADAARISKVEIFESTGLVWIPTQIVAIAPTGKRVFGAEIAHAEFEYAEPRRFDLSELRRVAIEAVEADPDDLWTQGALTHPAIVECLQQARTFEDIVDTLIHECPRA